MACINYVQINRKLVPSLLMMSSFEAMMRGTPLHDFTIVHCTLRASRTLFILTLPT